MIEARDSVSTDLPDQDWLVKLESVFVLQNQTKSVSATHTILRLVIENLHKTNNVRKHAVNHSGHQK